ncbi:MAG: transglycosylase domain-containing protein [Spirosomataceae bacterium]
MRQVLAYLQQFGEIIKSLIFHSLGWMGERLNWLAVKIVGEERTAQLYGTVSAYRTKFTNYLEERIDRDSPYYKPVSRLWKTFFWGLGLYWFGIFCLHTNFLWLTGEMPGVEELQNPKVAQSSELYTNDGVMLGKYFTENRTPIRDYNKLSPYLVKALIATEDERFYDHSGIDYKAWLGVAVGILKGGERGGGSTITQQLAKKLFKTRSKQGLAKKGLLGYIPGVKTLVYKAKEWLTAVKLERNYTKEEILLMYFNTVDYGSNAYGIKVAAKTYFNTSPDSLSLQEAAVLVGLQKATTTYNPMLHPDRSQKRRNVVLNQMVKNGYVTQHQADSVSSLPLVLKVNIEQPYAGSEGYFKKYINDYLNKWAEENEIDLDLYQDGLKIITTLDSRMQAHAEDALAEGMKQLQRTFDGHWGKNNPWIDEQGNEIPGFIDTVAKRTDYYKFLQKKYKNNLDSIGVYMNKPHKMKVFAWNAQGEKEVVMSAMDSIRYYKHFLQAGMMSMDPFNGYIKAWVGGLDYKYFKYDHVRQAKRQPGSTFKPIVYCSAIDGPKNLSPCYEVRDEPFEVEFEEGGEKKVWRPRNAEGYFTYSRMTLRRAMARSINSVAARITNEVGADTVVHYARKLGIKSYLSPVPSIGLGSFDVSLFEMISAYAPFLNGGFRTEPLLVARIEDQNGTVIHEFQAEREKVISEESAFLMRYMLQGGMQEPGGTSQNLWSFPELFPNYKAEYGGKTGTTSNYSDGWFMNITPELVTGAWVGGDDRSIHFKGKMGEGAKTALPLVGRFLVKVFTDPDLPYRPGPFPEPGFKILKDYKSCQTFYRPQTDSTAIGGDSLNFDPNISPDEVVPPDSTGGNR